MTKGVLLARVSTVRQEREGLSLKEIQVPMLRKYAAEHGIEIVKEFVYSETADRKIRKKFNEMLDFVTSSPEIEAVVAFRVDRITRNFRDAVAIDDLRIEHNKKIHFVYDRLVIDRESRGRDIQDWDLKVFLAKQYLNRLKEDAYNSANTKLFAGQIPGQAAFGYRNVFRDDKTKWVAIHDFEASIVKTMFELYASGNYSFQSVSDKIKEDFGKLVSHSMVDKILKRKFYHGVIEYNGEEYPHVYDTIVTKDLFDKVQKVRTKLDKRHSVYAGLPYAYRGLIKCATCGCSLTPEKKKGRYVYYHCTEYNGKHGAKWIREEDLTKQLVQIIYKIQVPEDVVLDITLSLKDAHKTKVDMTDQMVKGLQGEYSRYEGRIEKMYEDKLDGRITEEYYDKKCKEYRKKQDDVLTRVKRVQRADEAYYLTAEYLLTLAKRAGELFESSEPEEKRAILNLTLQNLRLNEDKLEYTWVKPFDTLAYSVEHLLWLPGMDSNHGKRIQIPLCYHYTTRQYY